MTPETAAPSPVESPAQTVEEQFAGFTTEAYHAGEVVADPEAPKTAPDASATPETTETTEEPVEEAQAGTEAPTEGTGESPRKQTVQERINEVTKLRREAERRAEAAERELATLRAAPVETPKPEATKAPPAEEGSKEPNPDDFDYGEIDPRYIRAVARYETEQVLAEERASRQQQSDQDARVQQHRDARSKFEEKVTTGSAKYEDYYEKVVEGAEKGAWPLSPDLGNMIVESDVGDEIAYHLATNPEEAIRVFHQSPLEQARYFGRLEAKFSAAGPAATGATPKQDPPAKTPKAPPPVLPARGAGGQFQATAATDDFLAFETLASGDL